MAAASNSDFITITIKNLAGYEKEIRIRKDIPVYLLRLRILLETTEGGYPFVEGPPFAMKLFKQTNMNKNNTRTMLTDPDMPINKYGIMNGNSLHVVMENAPPPLLNEGGKRSRRKSRRHCKSRGKKSRKH
jgi:hypothetical protein